MSSTATLAYSATAQGPTVPANLEAALAAIDLDPTPIFDMTAAVLATDTTTLTGTIATRTLVFNITNAEFQTRFPPTTDQACPFRGLYLQTIAGTLGTIVTEAAVVIA
jgi:hypothetical protein